MAQTNIFTEKSQDDILKRLEVLRHDLQPQWGKMNAAQMMAHLNVMFSIAFDQTYPKPNIVLKFILRLVLKRQLIGSKAYKKNSKTDPEMMISHQPDFYQEKKRLIDFIQLVHASGPSFFEQREHPILGDLSASQWSTLLYKHIDYHLTQFGV